MDCPFCNRHSCILRKIWRNICHKDIAFIIGSVISPVFKLYLLKKNERLQEEENKRLHTKWNFQRTLAKVNYPIHTDAIKENLFPKTAVNITEMATTEQLVVLSSINAMLIQQGIPQAKRRAELNAIAMSQMKSLFDKRQLRK